VPEVDDDARATDEPASPEVKLSRRSALASRVRAWAKWMGGQPLWRIALVGFLVLSAIVMFAATRPTTRPQPPVISTTPSASFNPPPANSDLISPPALSALTQTIVYLEDKYQTSLGVAIAPIAPAGRAFMRPWTGGSLVTGYAWATADLPVALAVLREPKEPNDPEYLLTRAFNDSSAAGDLALWQYLGTDTVAAEKTQAIIVEAGDLNTVVRVNEASAALAPFGQTRWTLSDQAMFMGSFYCMTESDRVLTHMRQPSLDDTYGLGLLPSVRVKSGSGTEPNGVDSLRQIALVEVATGTPYAVAVSAIAIDGSLATAKAALNELAPAIAMITHGMDGYC
jgi:hypothetical protein